LVPAEHPTRRPEQLFEQGELALGQTHRSAPHVGGSPDEVRHHPPTPEVSPGRRRRRLTDVSPDPGDQLDEAERLREVVDGARFQAPYLGLDRGEHGKDQDPLLRQGIDDAAQHLEPVQIGKQQIEDDQLVATGPCQIEPGSAVRCLADDEPLVGQRPRDEVRDRRFVLHHQDPRKSGPWLREQGRGHDEPIAHGGGKRERLATVR